MPTRMMDIGRWWRAAPCGASLVEKARGDVAGQSRRALADGIKTAPGRLDLRKHGFAALDDGGEHCTGACDTLGNDVSDHIILEKSGAAVRDLMLQRDPQMLGHGVRRRDRF